PSLLTMDTWLSSLNESAPKATLNSPRTQEQVIAGTPANAVDFCFLLADTTFSTKIFDMAVCDADAPQADGLGRLAKRASPRQVAGGPLTENILKCQLKPLNSADYSPLVLTSAQLGRLHNVFPDGVCDWDQPGVGQQRAVSPLTFADGPGGKRLPPPPVSHSGWRARDADDHDRDRRGHPVRAERGRAPVLGHRRRRLHDGAPRERAGQHLRDRGPRKGACERRYQAVHQSGWQQPGVHARFHQRPGGRRPRHVEGGHYRPATLWAHAACGSDPARDRARRERLPGEFLARPRRRRSAHQLLRRDR